MEFFLSTYTDYLSTYTESWFGIPEYTNGTENTVWALLLPEVFWLEALNIWSYIFKINAIDGWTP